MTARDLLGNVNTMHRKKNEIRSFLVTLNIYNTNVIIRTECLFW